MATTNNLILTLVETAQAQKEVTVNTALIRLDATLNTGAIDKDLNTPPGSPAEGDVYIISTAPTGAWAGKAKNIAYYTQTAWNFIAPKEGSTLWVNDENKLYTYDGANWALSVAGGRQTVWIPAQNMRQSASGGSAALAAIATAAGQPDIVSLDFDPTTSESAQFSISMRKAWNEGTVTAQFVWSHAATVTNFGVVWSLQAVARSDLDAMGTAFGTAVTVSDTGGTTNMQYVTAETTAITIAGTPAENDTVYFRVNREPANASDTMTIDARLHGIRLYFTTNAMTDD